MEYKPHRYQQHCIDYIISHPVSAIFLDCGLGKTAITLSAINALMFDCFDIRKVLVIAPLRVAKVTWSDEIEKWDNFNMLQYSIVVGSEKERLAALNKKANIYITNRENIQWLVEKSKVAFDFDMVVIDELSSFKNWNSKRFKAFMQIRPHVKRVVGLTGTPSPNGMMDLFAQFKCLDMGARLGRFITQYRSNYFVPDRMNGQIVYSYRLRPDAEQQIFDEISDITISMKALDHLDMPELISNQYSVYMNEKEVKMYEDLKKDLILTCKEDEVITAANAAALSNKLCQMANGAVYSENNASIHIHDQKLDALEDIVEAAQSPFLLCYWFKHDLERIETKLKELKVRCVRISDKESIRKWNDGKYQVGLIHPASAGHGLNLQQGGSMIVWFSIPWSLELYQQTNARLWRQGQNAKTVVIQHIITAGTIDEKILKSLNDKDSTQQSLIEAVKATLEVENV